MKRALAIVLLAIIGLPLLWYYGTETRTEVDTRSGLTRSIHYWCFIPKMEEGQNTILSDWLAMPMGKPEWQFVKSSGRPGIAGSPCFDALRSNLRILEASMMETTPLTPEAKSTIATRILDELQRGTGICRISKAMRPILDRFSTEAQKGTPTSSEEIVKAVQQQFP